MAGAIWRVSRSSLEAAIGGVGSDGACAGSKAARRRRSRSSPFSLVASCLLCRFVSRIGREVSGDPDVRRLPFGYRSLLVARHRRFFQRYGSFPSPPVVCKLPRQASRFFRFCCFVARRRKPLGVCVGGLFFCGSCCCRCCFSGRRRTRFIILCCPWGPPERYSTTRSPVRASVTGWARLFCCLLLLATPLSTLVRVGSQFTVLVLVRSAIWTTYYCRFFSTNQSLGSRPRSEVIGGL